MNDHEPYQEIEELLRADKPRVTPPPGLESRILNSIKASENPGKRSFLPWLFVPAAAAAGIIMLRPIPQPQQTSVTKKETPHIEQAHAPPVEDVVKELAVEERKLTAFFENPLDRETRALQRDARRAGLFLINALPSLNVAAE